MIDSCLDIDGSKVQGRVHGNLSGTRARSVSEEKTVKQASYALGIYMERIAVLML